MKYDLHVHSTASDGTLSPSALVARAESLGLAVMALTDHDSVTGLKDAEKEARNRPLKLVKGVEISCSWGGITIHVLALGIKNPGELDPLLRNLSEIREHRGELIGKKLEKNGVANALAETRKLAGEGCLTRTHYAKFLWRNNYANSMQDSFGKYLVRGKIAYVNVKWANLAQAVEYIHAGGAFAVIAHPGRYKMTNTRLEQLLDEFKSLGGDGMEVVAGSMNRDKIIHFSKLAQKYGLLASRGSDFHEPGPYSELGKIAELPGLCDHLIDRLDDTPT